MFNFKNNHCLQKLIQMVFNKQNKNEEHPDRISDSLPSPFYHASRWDPSQLIPYFINRSRLDFAAIKSKLSVEALARTSIVVTYPLVGAVDLTEVAHFPSVSAVSGIHFVTIRFNDGGPGIVS